MKTPLRAVATVAVAALLAACGGTSKSDVAASVNGVAISIERFAKVDRAIQAITGSSGCAFREGEDRDCTSFALTLMIQGELVRQSGEEVAATASEVNAVMDQFAQGDEAALGKLLSDGGATMEGLRDLARIQVFMQNGEASLGAQDDAALREVYEQNKAQFATIDTAHILLATEQEANDLLPQVTTENFSKMAAANSTDPSAKQNSGDLGPIPATQLVPEYSNAVLDAEKGQIIGPVKSEFGWHIILVKGIELPPFEDVKAQLEQQGPQAAFQVWLGAQMAEADIEVNPRYGTFDAEQGKVVPVNSTSPGTAPEPAQGQSGLQPSQAGR